MVDEPKRYLVIVQLKSEVPGDRIQDLALVKEWMLRFTGSQHEIAFRSKDGATFGYYFKPAADISPIVAHRIRGEFDKCGGTKNGDAMMIIEAGKLVEEVGLSRAATWLKHH